MAALGIHGKSGVDGVPMPINEVVPSHSLFTHPYANGSAQVSYALDGKFTTFKATVALGHCSDSPLTFEVLGDGKLLWRSEPINLGTTKECRVPIRKMQDANLESILSGVG